MSNENEKLTINLGVVELAQIDVLVEQGIYSNRSDFIRSSIRRYLESYKDKIENVLQPVSGRRNWRWTVGILTINKGTLLSLVDENATIRLSVIGMLYVENDVSAELFKKAVKQVNLRGKLVASDEIKSVINSLA